MKTILTIIAATSLLGCASKQPEAIIVVPSSATTSPAYNANGSIPNQRYVIRMSDGERDWEVEFPEVASGYVVRIPLKGEKNDGLVWESDNLTAADKELLKQLRRENPNMEREGIYVDGKNLNDPQGRNELGGFEPGAELNEKGEAIADPGKLSPQGKEDSAAPTRPSYFMGIQDVQKLFRSGNYELAMVRLVQLEKAYPNDVKLLSMKGTLWVRLGKKELAREAWEQVLQVDPDNRAVVEALKQLK